MEVLARFPTAHLVPVADRPAYAPAVSKERKTGGEMFNSRMFRLQPVLLRQVSSSLLLRR